MLWIWISDRLDVFPAPAVGLGYHSGFICRSALLCFMEAAQTQRSIHTERERENWDRALPTTDNCLCVWWMLPDTIWVCMCAHACVVGLCMWQKMWHWCVHLRACVWLGSVSRWSDTLERSKESVENGWPFWRFPQPAVPSRSHCPRAAWAIIHTKPQLSTNLPAGCPLFKKSSGIKKKNPAKPLDEQWNDMHISQYDLIQDAGFRNRYNCATLQLKAQWQQRMTEQNYVYFWTYFALTMALACSLCRA